MNNTRKVVLLGDSIRLIGYGAHVKDALGEGYTVWQPTDNCRYAQYTFRLLFEQWESLRDADVIHFNCGLWDVYDQFCEGETFSEIDAYVRTVERIARRLLSVTPNVLFSTTTPVKAAHKHVRNTDVARFNEAVIPRLAALGVHILDLHTLVRENVDTYVLDTDYIHLTEEGAKACAARVAEAIRTLTERS